MRLAAEGLVILEDHKGFRVAPVSRDEMIDIANTLLEELEAIAIRMATEKGDDRWEAEIVARFHELSKRQMFIADGTLDPEWEARNVAFHEALYAACGSPSSLRSAMSLRAAFAVSALAHQESRQTGPRRLQGARGADAGDHPRDAATAISPRKHRSATLQDVLEVAERDGPTTLVPTGARTGCETFEIFFENLQCDRNLAGWL